MDNQQEKIKKVEALFDEIKSILGNNAVRLSIHNINMEELPSNWRSQILTSQPENTPFKVARRNEETFDISLFSV